jgi:hypothetical protein
MIPPFIQQIVGVLVRALVVALAGYLAGHAGITLNDDQIGQIVTYLVPIVAVIAWSIYSKYGGRLKLLTAAKEAGMSEHEVEAQVRDRNVINPSVLTAKTDLPL